MRLSMIRELVGHAIDNGIASNVRGALEHIEWCRWREDVYFERFEEARRRGWRRSRRILTRSAGCAPIRQSTGDTT